jgi:hypothetical protein
MGRIGAAWAVPLNWEKNCPKAFEAELKACPNGVSGLANASEAGRLGNATKLSAALTTKIIETASETNFLRPSDCL